MVSALWVKVLIWLVHSDIWIVYIETTVRNRPVATRYNNDTDRQETRSSTVTGDAVRFSPCCDLETDP